MPIILMLGRAPDHAERTSGYAVATPVADIVLHIHIAEFVVDDRAGRAGHGCESLCAPSAAGAGFLPQTALLPRARVALAVAIPPRRVVPNPNPMPFVFASVLAWPSDDPIFGARGCYSIKNGRISDTGLKVDQQG